MRLTDPWFEATFVGRFKLSGAFGRLPSIDGAQGVLLISPCSMGGTNVGVHSVLVPFANPRNAPPVPPEFEPGLHRWQMAGTCLGDLTVSPSVDCTVERPEDVAANRAAGLGPGECRPGHRCWHGWIENGEVR